MQKKSLLVSLSFLMAITISAQEAKYEIKSGIINSLTEVAGQKMETVTYFDDYGKIETATMTMPQPGTSNTRRVKSIKKGNESTTFDLETKTGVMVITPEQSQPLNFLKITPETIEKYKLKEVGRKKY